MYVGMYGVKYRHAGGWNDAAKGAAIAELGVVLHVIRIPRSLLYQSLAIASQ
jgi:hypothetical protein